MVLSSPMDWILHYIRTFLSMTEKIIKKNHCDQFVSTIITIIIISIHLQLILQNYNYFFHNKLTFLDSIRLASGMPVIYSNLICNINVKEILKYYD